MHFEFLVEDQSGKAMLERLIHKIISAEHTFKIHPYKGIGHIPKGLNPQSEPDKRILLDQLPRLLRAFGNLHASYSDDYRAAVIIVCDLDSKNYDTFMAELNGMLNQVNPAPNARFCIAVEEGEAWFLGDRAAVMMAYPKAKTAVLNAYVQDSICGTWEVLADAVYPGGSMALAGRGYRAVGLEKSRWAENITPNMEVAENSSPSFGRFQETLEALAND